VTLSHCWGTGHVPRLSQTSLQLALVYILVENLPETFRDAIYITRRPGLEYIWIDSLCRIQESAVMGSVYRNSTLNLAATGAQDCLRWLLFRPPSKFHKSVSDQHSESLCGITNNRNYDEISDQSGRRTT
jgi:Heterokaryon incompatibility protein (HET)